MYLDCLDCDVKVTIMWIKFENQKQKQKQKTKNHKQCVRFIFVLELLYYVNRLLRPIIIWFNVHL